MKLRRRLDYEPRLQLFDCEQSFADFKFLKCKLQVVTTMKVYSEDFCILCIKHTSTIVSTQHYCRGNVSLNQKIYIQKCKTRQFLTIAIIIPTYIIVRFYHFEHALSPVFFEVHRVGIRPILKLKKVNLTFS